ncbi:MAG: threonylcarbamoyl-AMP synthase [Verrucomicrobia bacterium GWC2_42_7]|nr:MAG: threonylcarbamoyl-AMP synthase [Verrucomicrobia bacterium GWC2_42_7]
MPIYSGSVEGIELASQALMRGDAVALPTETVYGLAANALDAVACAKIFEIKGRPLIDPLIVHVLNWGQADSLACMPSDARLLADAFWPGPLTLVVRRKEVVPDIVTAGKPTVAIRMPRHPIFRLVLEKTGLPLAAPSANPFGYISPTTAQHVMDSLGSRIHIIIDGGCCDDGIESTILDLSHEVPTILRPGPVSREEIAAVLKCPVEMRVATKAAPQAQAQEAPGLLKEHYCPHTPFFLFEKECPSITEKGTVAVVYLNRPSQQQTELSKEATLFWLSESGDLKEVARNLFALLRKLDSLHLSAIYMQRPPQDGIGISINDRLSRAAARYR